MMNQEIIYKPNCSGAMGLPLSANAVVRYLQQYIAENPNLADKPLKAFIQHAPRTRDCEDVRAVGFQPNEYIYIVTETTAYKELG